MDNMTDRQAQARVARDRLAPRLQAREEQVSAEYVGLARIVQQQCEAKWPGVYVSGFAEGSFQPGEFAAIRYQFDDKEFRRRLAKEQAAAGGAPPTKFWRGLSGYHA